MNFFDNALKPAGIWLAALFTAVALVACSSADTPESQAEAPSTEGAPQVIMETSAGNITLALNPKAAPLTVENFLTYVDAGFYDDLIFHRVIDGFMIQGGGFDQSLVQQSTRDPIRNEADNGLSNTRGTIAMARTQDPHSATAQFFINLEDNRQLDQRGSQWGYAVFGEVVEGMEVVREIGAVETGTRPTPRGAMGDVPVEPVVIRQIRRNEH